MRLGLTVCAVLLICYVSRTQTKLINQVLSPCFPIDRDYVRGQRKSWVPPVVLIPGLAGSQLEASIASPFFTITTCPTKSGEWTTLWLSGAKLTYVFIECWARYLKLTYNTQTKKTTNTPGVTIRTPKWGDTYAIEYLNDGKDYVYFAEIIHRLVDKHNYVRNVSLRGAPYDFRKGPDELDDYFENLKALIEETYAINRNDKVTLIAHSMGGLLSLAFLQRQSQEWKDKYINTLVTIGTPWGGSMKSLKVLAMGDDFDKWFLSAKAIRVPLRTMPSLGFLLPSKLFWNDDEVLVETNTRNYTLADLKQYLIDIDVPNAWEFRQNNEKYQLDIRPPGVELHCLYGEELRTIERLKYGPGVSIGNDPEIIYGDGDGTVNKRSLEGCLRWETEQTQKVTHKKFPGADHVKILQDEDLIDYIRRVIDDAQYERHYLKPRKSPNAIFFDD